MTTSRSDPDKQAFLLIRARPSKEGRAFSIHARARLTPLRGLLYMYYDCRSTKHHPHGAQVNKQVGKLAIVAAAGLFTSIAVAIIHIVLETGKLGSLYGLMLWFVIPAGAILCGVAAASGYMVGARFTGQRPTPALLTIMLLTSLGTYLLIHWLHYHALNPGPAAINEQISFLRYFNLEVTHQSLRTEYRGIELGQVDDVGRFGYVIAILQLLGFCSGAFANYVFLKKMDHCVKCDRYFRRKGVQSRKANSEDELDAVVNQVQQMFSTGQIQAALDYHDQSGERASNHLNRSSTMSLKSCPACDLTLVNFIASSGQNNTWGNVGTSTWGLRVAHPGKLNLPGKQPWFTLR
jgi:hypothetical protein